MTTVGLTDTELASVRRTAGAVVATSTRGQRLTLALMLDDHPQVDPIVASTITPMRAWLYDVWDERLPRAMLGNALRDAIEDTSGGTVPWARVRGPASALVATLWRVQWTFESEWVWLDHCGQRFDVRSAAPKDVIKAAALSVRNWQSERVALSVGAPHLAVRVFLSPLRQLLFSPVKGLSPRLSGLLRSVVVNLQWPQQRLWESGLVDDPLCTLCSDEPGTIAHRAYRCHAHDIDRMVWNDEPLMQLGAAARLSDPLWSRGLVEDPAKFFPPSDLSGNLVWQRPPPDGLFRRRVYIDGSCTWPAFPGLRRAGAAFVMLANEPRM